MITKKDLNNLESIFLLSAIDYYEGKRKAAQALGTSVDTINKYVDSLEEELGTRLLLNTGRGSVLTPGAKGLVEHAGKIKEVLNDIYMGAADKEDVKGTVRIGLSESVAAMFPMMDCGFFMDKYPAVNLTFLLSMDKINFNNSGVDLLLSFDKPDGTDVVVVATANISLGFFASPEYLSKNGYPVDEDDMLKNHRLICKEGNRLNPNLKLIYKRAKNLNLAANSNYTIVQMVQSNMGIAMMPTIFKNSGFVCLDNIPCEESFTLYLSAYRNTKDIQRVRLVLNFFKELMESM